MLEWAVRGRFSPLPAPFPLRDLPLRTPLPLHRFLPLPLHAPLRSALRSRSIVFCHSRSTLRSAPHSAPLRTPLRSALRSRSIVFCHARSTLRSAPPDFRPAPLTCSGCDELIALCINMQVPNTWNGRNYNSLLQRGYCGKYNFTSTINRLRGV